MTSSPDIRGPARETRMAQPVDGFSGGEEPAAEILMAEHADDSGSNFSGPSVAQPSRRAGASPSPNGLFPLLLGGLVAGAIGFAVARFALPPAVDPELPSRITSVEQTLEGLGDRLDGIDATIADVADRIPERDTETPAAVEALGSQLEALRSDVAGLRSTVDSLSDTVANLAIGGDDGQEAPDFAAAFENQMSQFQAEVDRVTANAAAEAEAARTEAEATRAAAEAEAAAALEAAAVAERQANLRAGLAEVQIAIDTGAPFAGALGLLDGVEIPQALASVAEDGVLPLTELQRTFPEAARAALQAADRSPDEAASPVGKFTAFLLAQTNARSLEPRDGDSADAVLSRAEAALKSGDLAATLSEIGALAEGPLSAISSWLEGANTRNAAVAAVAELNSTVDAM